MFIEISRNTGKKYLRLSHSVREKNSSGKSCTKKEVVFNIGPLDKYDDGQPNYIERLRASYANGAPLIDSLLPYCSKVDVSKEHTFTFKYNFREGNQFNCFNTTKIGHIILEKIIEELGLTDFIATYKMKKKITYDLYGFFKLLIFGRLLDPASKIATVRQNGMYFSPMLDDFNPDNVYDTLSFIAEHKDKMIRRLNTNLVKRGLRDPELMFYDVTNFYYEIENPDKDVLDENGNILQRGMRKMGVSKEERKLPIVQMGLFMDDAGLPVAIESFPGNTLDHQTFIESFNKHMKDLGLKRYIIISDRGVYNGKNVLHVLNAGHGYIMAKSLLKSNKVERNWIYNESDYIKYSDDYKYKSLIVNRKINDENGIEHIITEKIVAYWSRKYAKHAIKENESFIDFLQKVIESPASFRITSVQTKQFKKFLNKKLLNVKTGEEVNSHQLRAMLDMKKVNEYMQSFGYYQLVTSEIDMPEMETINKYHRLTEIENQFRMLKGNLKTRPLFVRTREHIDAHLLICMISLLTTRIIQIKINEHTDNPDKENKKDWVVGMSHERIKKALNSWGVAELDKNQFIHVIFRGEDKGKNEEEINEDLMTIFKTFDIKIPSIKYSLLELKQIKKTIKIFE